MPNGKSENILIIIILAYFLSTKYIRTFETPGNNIETCGYSPPPILRVGGGVTLLLVYYAHLGRGCGRGQNIAVRKLKPKGKKTSYFS